MTARELALASFWTERPLVRRYIEATGADTFSLKQLIAFAESLPQRDVQQLTGAANGDQNLDGLRSMDHR